MAKEPDKVLLLPLNGQYWTIDGFVKQIEKAIMAANSYDTGTGQPMDHKIRRELFRALAVRFAKWQ